METNETSPSINEAGTEVTFSRYHLPPLIVLIFSSLVTLGIIGVFLCLQTNPFFLNPPNAWWTIIYFKSMVGAGVFIILSGASFVLYKKKKYIISAIISILVVSLFIFFFSKIVSVYRNHIRILDSQVDSPSLIRGTDMTDDQKINFNSSSGLLVPSLKTDSALAGLFSRSEVLDLSIPGFYYLKYLIATTTLHSKAFVTFSETSANFYSPTAYTQEVMISESVIKNKSDRTLYHFSYAGSPGMIVVAQVTGREDLVSYILNWNDHGKNVSIWMYYVPKDIFTKEQIIDLLGSLERTP